MLIADFNTAFSKDIKETFDNQSKEAINNAGFSKFFDVSDTSEYTSSYTSTEGIEAPEFFEEGEDLKRTSLQKGYKVTFSSAIFGQSISITKHARAKLNDNTEKIAEYANTQKNNAIVAMHNKLETTFAGVMNYTNATNASYKILSPDLLAIAADAHVWKSTGTTFDNNLGISAIDITNAATVTGIGGAFVDAQGNSMPLVFNKIFVKTGSAAAQQAKAVYAAKDAQGQFQVASIGGINLYSGSVQVIEIPYMTSGNDYIYMADADMLGIANPFFVEFLERPTAQGTFTESENLTWTMPWTCTVKYGLRNLPFNVLYGKVA